LDMARKLRVEYPGALYHVMNRGDHREPVFRDDRDRQCFVETLGEACQKTGWQVHAYLAKMGERRGANHYGEECRETAEAKAERIVAEELRGRGWSEAELGARAKGDKEKVAVAVRLRGETTMTLKWVAKRLAMGSWSNVSNLLAAAQKKAR